MAWLFGLLSLGIGSYLYFALSRLFKEMLSPPAPPLPGEQWHPEYWRVATVIAAALFSVWIIRVLVRLLMSNIHLQTEARQRMTMVKTYLALLRADKMPRPEDTQLMLQALFRPSSTGLIRHDDGVPLGLAELATKVTTRTPPT
jgi:hypothetical protein